MQKTMPVILCDFDTYGSWHTLVQGVQSQVASAIGVKAGQGHEIGVGHTYNLGGMRQNQGDF